MSAKTAEDLIAAARALAPEAVFSEPWEARAFAVAVALSEAGQFQWAEFQQSLIEEIGAAEKAGTREERHAILQPAFAAEDGGEGHAQRRHIGPDIRAR